MELAEIVRHFPDCGSGELRIQPITDGLINATYLVEAVADGRKFILQKINTSIFQNPGAVARNHNLVDTILGQTAYPKQRVQQLKTRAGEELHRDAEQAAWRMMGFVNGATTVDKADSPQTALEAAKTLSEFLFFLNQTPGTEPEESLPGFVDFEKRVRDYKAALAAANPARQQAAAAEISFVNDHLSLPDQWIAWQNNGQLPRRIIHGDPKISNVLFDGRGNGLCVIDLDTVMPGTLLYDFGDMARSYTNRTTEDDAQMTEVFDAGMYRAVKQGFASHLEPLLTPIEADNLDYAAQTVIFIQALRFLADYLGGDNYYTTHYPGQNLDRTRNQLALLRGLQQFCGIS